MEEIVVLYGQPGSGLRETGPKKRNKSLRFLRDFEDPLYDFYYGSLSFLPDWATLPSAFWAYDMGGFYEMSEIRDAVIKAAKPYLIVSYVPFNAKKAYETVTTAAKDRAIVVLVYNREDKATFLSFMKHYQPFGLCDDQHENCRMVAEIGFRAIHCTVGTNAEIKEEDIAKTKTYEGNIDLAESIEELLELL